MLIDLTINIWKEGNQYVAHALPLDVMSSGPTPDAARLAVDEAVQGFIQTAIEAGTVQQVLEDCGYLQQDGAWRSPDWIGIERRTLSISA